MLEGELVGAVVRDLNFSILLSGSVKKISA
jgi:hypothetical protein